MCCTWRRIQSFGNIRPPFFSRHFVADESVGVLLPVVAGNGDQMSDHRGAGHLVIATPNESVTLVEPELVLPMFIAVRQLGHLLPVFGAILPDTRP